MPPSHIDLAAGAVVSFVAHVVSGVLGLVGLPPLIGNSPTMPAEPPTLWVVLAWVRREFTNNYLNQTPTATSKQTSQTVSGMVGGTITGTDAEGDPLTYRLAQGPAQGTVTVSPDAPSATRRALRWPQPAAPIPSP